MKHNQLALEIVSVSRSGPSFFKKGGQRYPPDNLFAVDKAVGCPSNTHPLDRDLSDRQHYPPFQQLECDIKLEKIQNEQ